MVGEFVKTRQYDSLEPGRQAATDHREDVLAKIFGTNSIDNLAGTPVADEIFGYPMGGNPDDDLGGDILRGFGGDDKIYGGGGDDLMVGDGGADIFTGGIGIDTASNATTASP